MQRITEPKSRKYTNKEILNAYHITDALDFMKNMRRGSVQGIVTSPPYNKKFRHRSGISNWKNSKLMAANYTNYDDDLSDEEYISWQRSIIDQALRIVGDNGVVVYNIGRTIKKLHEDLRTKIVNDFPVRQTIIWNRGSSNNQGGKRPTILPPIYELIYIIAGKEWRLPKKHLKEMRKWGDVWRVPFEINNPHPAPFPVKLAERMVKLVDGAVLDPFAGSGTTGVAAINNGYPYCLLDISKDYKKMFEDRIGN